MGLAAVGLFRGRNGMIEAEGQAAEDGAAEDGAGLDRIGVVTAAAPVKKEAVVNQS